LDGLRGPIVIKDPQDPNKRLYDVDDETTVIVLADWFHDPAPGLQATYLSVNNTIGIDVLPKSGTINGG
jgi:iron transport multicopper oxidase